MVIALIDACSLVLYSNHLMLDLLLSVNFVICFNGLKLLSFACVRRCCSSWPKRLSIKPPSLQLNQVMKKCSMTIQNFGLMLYQTFI